MSRLRAVWQLLLGSLWFVPAVVVAACIALALLLIEAHGWGDADLAQQWPRVFGAGSDGARSMLTAIATSMATVAGVVFSVTIVALSLTATQYSPRVLGNFMNDRPTQFVLGVFVGVFAYCLVVLRTVRSDASGEAFLPSYAVLGGVGLALFGVAMLIYFIHHVASSIQASSIVERIANDTADAIDALFPQPIGDAVEEPPPAGERLEPRWVVTARRTGYLVGVDDDGLLEFAVEQDCAVHLARRIGDFVIEGQPLARLSGTRAPDEARSKELRALFDLQRQRTIHQDAPYGVQQLVDVAVKALSPGINDPTTATMCIDRLAALLLRLAGRRMPGPCRGRDGVLRVVAQGPDFAGVTALALDPIVAHARGDAMVLARLLDTLEQVAACAPPRAGLHARLALLEQAIERDVGLPMPRGTLLARVRELAPALRWSQER